MAITRLNKLNAEPKFVLHDSKHSINQLDLRPTLSRHELCHREFEFLKRGIAPPRFDGVINNYSHQRIIYDCESLPLERDAGRPTLTYHPDMRHKGQLPGLDNPGQFAKPISQDLERER